MNTGDKREYLQAQIPEKRNSAFTHGSGDRGDSLIFLAMPILFIWSSYYVYIREPL